MGLQTNSAEQPQYPMASLLQPRLAYGLCVNYSVVLNEDSKSGVESKQLSGRRVERHTMKLPDMEAVARKVHEAWMQAKLAQGIQTRKSETGEELMVDYDQLSEEAKELDRGSVRAVYAAIESLQEES